jgi:CRISPR-associated protein Csb1
MSEILTQYDNLLKDTGPAAIVLEHWLKPVGGDVIFPPTYANPSQRRGDPPVYNIDRFGDTVNLGKRFTRFEKSHTFMDETRVEEGREHSVCVIDSIPSQANRIEPALGRITDKDGKRVRLVPTVIVEVKIGDEVQRKSLLEDAGHRVADALLLSSTLREKVTAAIRSRQDGDSAPLAKLAPTSLVFGMWDSRESGTKVPRLINSIIRAYGVLEHRRSSQFHAAIDYEAAGVVAGKGDKKLSEVGMDSAPAVFQHGGIEAKDGIRRDASLNLCTLRDIVTATPEATRTLQRYILELSLVAMTYFDGKTLNLRQGCQLVAIKEKPMRRTLVYADGAKAPFDIDREDAISYATAVAEAFGVGEDETDVTFDPKLAMARLKRTAKDKEGLNK